MKFFNLNRKSIRFRVTVLIIILIIVQATLLSLFLVIGGVLKQAENNAFTSFSDKVTNRRDYLQREMNFNWTNMDPYVEQIAIEFDKEDAVDDYFNKISNELISMLRTTQATGAFVILDRGGSDFEKPALYIRDYDPNLNNYGNKDLYLIHGPSNLANKLQIPLDQMWKYKIELNRINSDFYEKPFSKASLSEDGKLLGYWSKPFRLYSNDIPIITYTRPLYDSKDNVIGIIGIEISEQQLCKFLPSTDLETKDSYGYLIGFKENGDSKLEPLLLTKAIQKRLFKGETSISYSNVNQKIEIFKLKNVDTATSIYITMDQLGLYQTNTPFQNNQWYLVGMMSENHLFSYVKRIQGILWVATISSIIIGVIVGYIVSFRFTKPITALANKVKDSDKSTMLELEETGLTEVDELSKAIQMASKELLESTIKMSRIIELVGLPIGAYEYSDHKDTVFVTDQLKVILSISEKEMTTLVKDKHLFIDRIKHILEYPDEEEEDIYVVQGDTKKWLKLKYIENVTSTIGVIIDMTEEMLVKKQIIQDRDMDTLTGIYSRKAMQDHMEHALRIRNQQLYTAILMFDLDNLKIINDTYGHKWGDTYIRHAVRHLSQMSEENLILGRRSGDEFTVLLYDFPTKDQLIKVLHAFFGKLEKDLLQFPDGVTKKVSISGGLVWIYDSKKSYDEYLQMADEALYRAKENQKGSCYEYSSMESVEPNHHNEME